MIKSEYLVSLILLPTFLPLAQTRYVTSQQRDNAASYYNAGTEHYRLGRYKEAAEAFKKAIALNSDQAEAYRELGNSYFSSGEYWKAYEAYLPALRLHSEYGWKSKEREWFEARINLAITYSIIGNRLGVLGIFSSEIVDSPTIGDDLIAHIKSSKAEVYLYLGEAYLQVANGADKRTVYLTAAVEAFKRAIDIAPKYAEAFTFLGRAYGEMKQHKNAVAAYQQAIKTDGRYSAAYYYLGLAYLDIGDRQSALKQYRTLNRMDQDLAKKLYRLIGR